jgi:hypothetical protein
MTDNDPTPPPATEPLPPGAGSPLVPGPPMSVGEPIKDTALNRGGLLMFAGIAVVGIIVVLILIAVLHH